MKADRYPAEYATSSPLSDARLLVQWRDHYRDQQASVTSPRYWHTSTRNYAFPAVSLSSTNALIPGTLHRWRKGSYLPDFSAPLISAPYGNDQCSDR